MGRAYTFTNGKENKVQLSVPEGWRSWQKKSVIKWTMPSLPTTVHLKGRWRWGIFRSTRHNKRSMDNWDIELIKWKHLRRMGLQIKGRLNENKIY